MTPDNQNSARGLTPEAVEEALQAVDSRPWGDETLYECKGGYLHAKPLAAEVRRLRALLASRADAPPTQNAEAWQLLHDIRDGKVNPEDEADKFLREFPAPDTPPRGEALPRNAQDWPEAWKSSGFNGVIETAKQALKFLTKYTPYAGGQVEFNVEHLSQIVEELEVTRQVYEALFACLSPPPALPVAQAKRWECEDCGLLYEPKHHTMREIEHIAGCDHDCCGCGWKVCKKPLIPLFTHAAPALSAPKVEACANCGKGLSAHESGDTACPNLKTFWHPAPALSEGLTCACGAKINFGSYKAEHLSAKLYHYKCSNAACRKTEPAGGFEEMSDAVEACRRLSSPAAPLTDDDFEKAFSEWEDGTILPTNSRKAFSAGWANALRLLSPAAPLEGENHG